jgi:hypothetical protein
MTPQALSLQLVVEQVDRLVHQQVALVDRVAVLEQLT